MSFFYYIPPCPSCNKDFKAPSRDMTEEEQWRIPMECKDCKMTVCMACSYHGSICPYCKSIHVSYNDIFIDQIRRFRGFPTGVRAPREHPVRQNSAGVIIIPVSVQDTRRGTTPSVALLRRTRKKCVIM